MKQQVSLLLSLIQESLEQFDSSVVQASALNIIDHMNALLDDLPNVPEESISIAMDASVYAQLDTITTQAISSTVTTTSAYQVTIDQLKQNIQMLQNDNNCLRSDYQRLNNDYINVSNQLYDLVAQFRSLQQEVQNGKDNK